MKQVKILLGESSREILEKPRGHQPLMVLIVFALRIGLPLSMADSISVLIASSGSRTTRETARTLGPGTLDLLIADAQLAVILRLIIRLIIASIML